MTRKQWINNMCDQEALKIHNTFRMASKSLSTLPATASIKGNLLKDKQFDFNGARRKAVRTFLRINKLHKVDLNVQYGRLAAGLTIERLYK